MSSYIKWDRADYLERVGGEQEAEHRRKVLMHTNPEPESEAVSSYQAATRPRPRLRGHRTRA